MSCPFADVAAWALAKDWYAEVGEQRVRVDPHFGPAAALLTISGPRGSMLGTAVAPVAGDQAAAVRWAAKLDRPGEPWRACWAEILGAWAPATFILGGEPMPMAETLLARLERAEKVLLDDERLAYFPAETNSN